MGVPIDGPANMLIDNNSVVVNCSIPSSVLKKKHLLLSYNRVQEACAAKIVRIKYIPSKENLADILTKPLGGTDFYNLV